MRGPGCPAPSWRRQPSLNDRNEVDVVSSDLIQSLHARQVLDSRGHPTVEVEVHCAGGAMGRAIAPSGASTGKHEARELRDEDPKYFDGRSVLRAVAHVNGLIGSPRGSPFIGMSASAQKD